MMNHQRVVMRWMDKYFLYLLRINLVLIEILKLYLKKYDLNSPVLLFK